MSSPSSLLTEAYQAYRQRARGRVATSLVDVVLQLSADLDRLRSLQGVVFRRADGTRNAAASALPAVPLPFGGGGGGGVDELVPRPPELLSAQVDEVRLRDPVRSQRAGRSARARGVHFSAAASSTRTRVRRLSKTCCATGAWRRWWPRSAVSCATSCVVRTRSVMARPPRSTRRAGCVCAVAQVNRPSRQGWWRACRATLPRRWRCSPPWTVCGCARASRCTACSATSR